MRHLRLAALFALSLLLVSCGGNIKTPGEALRISAQSLDPAYVGEPYSSNVQVVGGLSPYSCTVSKGKLPPGLALQDCTIRGTPSKTGSYSFTVTVSDANLSQTFKDYSLRVGEAPPAKLVLHAPNTQMRAPFTLHAEIQQAKGLEGFRTLISWDASRFELVPDSVRAVKNDLALLFKAQPGQLNVAVAVLGGTLSGSSSVFEFALEPLAPSTVYLTMHTEYVSTGDRHGYDVTNEGVRPAPAQSGGQASGGAISGGVSGGSVSGGSGGQP
jgi:hypothetical protein